MFDKNRWIEGRVKIEIDGANMERFFNISSKRNLLIEQVNQKSFFTTPKDFREMKPVARKTGVHLKIKGRQGLPFFLYRNRMRKLLGTGAIVFLFLLFFSSMYIWDISFVGNRRYTDDLLLEYLERMSIYSGVKKSIISCDDLEDEIRNSFTDITWVSAEIRGTRLIIRIKENEERIDYMAADESPCDLMAGQRGIIKEVIVRNGFAKVKVGDIVEKGDLLVDGTIMILDDAGNLVTKHEIHADADIIAETEYMVKKNVDLSRMEKVRTGVIRNGFYLRVLEYTCYFLLPSFSDHLWEVVMDQKQVCLVGDFCLPIYWGNVSAYEYEEYERFYTETEVKEIEEGYLQEYKEKLSEKGVQIIGNDGKIEGNESGWIITETLVVRENIAVETRPSGKYEEN